MHSLVADGHVFVPMLRLSKLTTEAPLFSIFVTPRDRIWRCAPARRKREVNHRFNDFECQAPSLAILGCQVEQFIDQQCGLTFALECRFFTLFSLNF